MSTPNARRVLLEAGVIVGSILLAFGIDAAWDERQERIEEREILEALHAEYSNNVEEAMSALDYYDLARTTLETFYTMSEQAVRALDAEERGRVMSLFCNPASFHAVLGTTDALIGAGKLELIRDMALRGALTTYVNLVEDAVEDIGYIADDAQLLWQREIALGGPWSEPGAELTMGGQKIPIPSFVRSPEASDLLRLRSDAAHTGRVRRCHLNAGYYVVEVALLRDQAEQIVALIEAGHPELGH